MPGPKVAYFYRPFKLKVFFSTLAEVPQTPKAQLWTFNSFYESCKDILGPKLIFKIN